MFYLYLLLFLSLLVAVIFITPLRFKVWVTTAVIAITALALAVPSIAVLAGAENFKIVEMIGPLFGQESLTIDSLAAIFLLIIAIAGCATLIYSKGYAGGDVERRFFVPAGLGVDDNSIVYSDSV